MGLHYSPVDVTIELTSRCNLDCWHCISSSGEEAAPEELTIDEWKKIINELRGLGTKKIIFSGGEPTLVPGFDRLIALVAMNNMEYSFVTNGYEVPNRILKAITKFRPYTVGVSLDGNEAVHNSIRMKNDSWGRSLKTIKILRDQGQHVTVITTVTNWNFHTLNGLSKIVSEIADSWRLQLAIPFGRMKLRDDSLISENDFKELCSRLIDYRKAYAQLDIEAGDCFGMAPPGTIRSAKWAGCSAGIWSLGIDSRGEVLPCLSIRNGMSGGNVKTESVEDIWSRSKYIGMFRWFKPDYAMGGKCDECSQLDECHGGCAGMSYAYYGEFHYSPFCYFRSFDMQGG